LGAVAGVSKHQEMSPSALLPPSVSLRVLLERRELGKERKILG